MQQGLSASARSALPKITLAFMLLVIFTLSVTYERSLIPTTWLWGLTTQLNVDGFLAAMWASIAVTLFFGLLTAWLGLRDPERDSIGQRVRNLFPRRSAPQGVDGYLQDRVKELAAIATHGEITISVKEYRPATSAYKIEVQGRFFLSNMLMDIPCRTPILLHVSPDEVDEPYIGEVTVVKSWCIRHSRAPNDGATGLIYAGQQYFNTLEVEIERGGESVYEYSFWAWSKSGEPWRVGARFYAANVDVVLKHRILGPEKFNVRYHLLNDGSVVNGTEAYKTSICNGDTLRLFEGVILAGHRQPAAFTLSHV